MNLYQFVFGHQPHYVVARNYGEAEKQIGAAGYGTPGRIECLGPYVILPTDPEATQ